MNSHTVNSLSSEHTRVITTPYGDGVCQGANLLALSDWITCQFPTQKHVTPHAIVLCSIVKSLGFLSNCICRVDHASLSLNGLEHTDFMSEYFSSFIVEPVVRQARRLSLLSSGEESPRFLPAVSESLRTWYPSRLWNTSPPASISEDDNQEHYKAPNSTLVGQWATRIPSPPLEEMESGGNDTSSAELNSAATVVPFPTLKPQTPHNLDHHT